MSLTHEDVKKIAHLARIEIKDNETEHYQTDLNKILHMVEQMDKVNTDHITPMSHPMDVSQRLRQDSVTETNQREQLQAVAPAVEYGYYLVPKVIEGATEEVTQ